MQKSGREITVGFFVLIALIVLGALLLQFSRGTTFFRSGYELRVRTANVSGMVVGASVQLSGVKVGQVSRIELASDNKTVTLVLKIDKGRKIHPDARFAIETSGFLGDQFVAIYPQENRGTPLADGAVVTAQEPFNIQEMARSASGFLRRIDEVARRLNDAIDRIDRTVLNDETLTNLSDTVHNLRAVSTQAFETVGNLRSLVQTNSAPISASVSNLHYFSGELNGLAGDFRDLIRGNTSRVASAVSNVEASTEKLKSMIDELQAGRGLAGQLLKNEELALHVSAVASNLAVTTSNLNSRGLWGILWKPKAQKRETSKTGTESGYVWPENHPSN